MLNIVNSICVNLKKKFTFSMKSNLTSRVNHYVLHVELDSYSIRDTINRRKFDSPTIDFTRLEIKRMKRFHTVLLCSTFFLSVLAVWIYSELRSSFILLSMSKKSSFHLKLQTVSCLSKGPCSIFDVFCYSNGLIIFDGIQGTAHLGQRFIQLKLDEQRAIGHFLKNNQSDLGTEGPYIFARFNFDNDQMKYYFYAADSSKLRSLFSLLKIDRFIKHQYSSLIFHSLRSKQPNLSTFQKDRARTKRSIESDEFIVPLLTTEESMPIEYEFIPTYHIISIQTISLIVFISNVDSCLSSEIPMSFAESEPHFNPDEIVNEPQFKSKSVPLKEKGKFIDDT